MKLKITEEQAKMKINSPSKVSELLKCFLSLEDEIDQDKEHFWVLHLNTKNKIKCCECVSIGTLNMAITEPREVFTRAVRERSASIIIGHNHPSGEVEPSDTDIELTQILVDAGKILRIPVLDHVIIGNDGSNYWSMKTMGQGGL